MSEYGSFRRHVAAVPFELVMLGGAAVTLAEGNWKHLAASLFTLGVSFLPLFIERRFRIKLSALVQTMYVAFVFASMFAGEVLGMYGRIWIWDDIMHFTSGLLVGLAVMFWLVLFVRQRKQFHMPVWFEALTIFCVATAVAVMWELIEFASDRLLGTFSQGNDLPDTMFDLMYGSGSGLIMAISWVFHLKSRRIFATSLLLTHFERLNMDKDVS